MLTERSSDPKELTNLVADPAHAATLKQMGTTLAEWVDKTDDSGRREFFAKGNITYSKV
jgi:hypothetical protein